MCTIEVIFRLEDYLSHNTGGMKIPLQFTTACTTVTHTGNVVYYEDVVTLFWHCKNKSYCPYLHDTHELVRMCCNLKWRSIYLMSYQKLWKTVNNINRYRHVATLAVIKLALPICIFMH